MTKTITELKNPEVAVFRRLWSISYDLPGTEETALFDEASSSLLLLNDVGAAIWELIDGARSVADLVEFVVEVRGNSAEAEAIGRDVNQFLVEMLERGSIVRVS